MVDIRLTASRRHFWFRDPAVVCNLSMYSEIAAPYIKISLAEFFLRCNFGFRRSCKEDLFPELGSIALESFIIGGWLLLSVNVRITYVGRPVIGWNLSIVRNRGFATLLLVQNLCSLGYLHCKLLSSEYVRDRR